MLYYSYGSNMFSKRFLKRLPAAKFITVATLFRHQLKFHKPGSQDGSGKCDAYETGNADHSITGIVYDISASEKVILDRIEGLHHGYEQKGVEVNSTDNSSLQAFTYFATDIDPTLKPFHWYRKHVIMGATEHNFPEHYIQSIARVKSIDDPVAERHNEEMSIYY